MFEIPRGSTWGVVPAPVGETPFWRGELRTPDTTLHTARVPDRGEASHQLAECLAGREAWTTHEDEAEAITCTLSALLPSDMEEWCVLARQVQDPNAQSSDLADNATPLFEELGRSIERLLDCHAMYERLVADPMAAALFALPLRGAALMLHIELETRTRTILRETMALGVLCPLPWTPGEPAGFDYNLPPVPSPDPGAVAAAKPRPGTDPTWPAAMAQAWAKDPDRRATFAWWSTFGAAFPSSMKTDGRAAVHRRLSDALSDPSGEGDNHHGIPEAELGRIMAFLASRIASGLVPE